MLRTRKGGVGREGKEEGEDDGVPSYDASVQGHTKKGRKGFPAMTKASNDTRKGSRQVFPVTSKRPATHQGEECT